MKNLLIEPPIKWGLWIVYIRLADGRIMYYRGKQYAGKYRKTLFIDDFKSSKTGDWSWEHSHCRLFMNRPSFKKQNFTKDTWKDPLRERINFRGFDGLVLKSHLII